MKHMASRRALVIIIVAVILMMSLTVLFSANLLQSASVNLPYNPTTVLSSCSSPPGGSGYTDYFYNAYGSGGFPVPPGQTQTVDGQAPPQGGGELMDSDVYWLSWQPGIQSQTIAVQGYIRSCWKPYTGASSLDFVKYVVQQSNDGSTWHTVRNLDLPNGFAATPQCGLAASAPLQALTFHLYGQSYNDSSGQQIPILDGSLLKVSMYFGIWPGRSGCQSVKPTDNNILWYGPFATDVAQLRNALPHGYFSGGQNGPTGTAASQIYQINDTFAFHWTVPVTQVTHTNSQGQTVTGYEYTMTITNDNLGTPVTGWDNQPITTTTGVASFKIDNSFFSSTPGMPNDIHVQIQGAIVIGLQAWVSTIDNASKAPILVSTVVSPNKQAYQQGDVISLTVTGKSNPDTKLPIVRATVHMDINGESFAGGDLSTTTITNNSDGSFSATFSNIRIPYSGILNVNSVMYDSFNRPSGYLSQSYFVGNSPPDKCAIYPNLSECQTGGFGWLVWVVALLIGIAFVLAGIFVPPFTLAWPYKLLLIIVGGVVIYVAVFILR